MSKRKKSEQMPEKEECLSWVESLYTKAVVILEHADLLTFKQTSHIRNTIF